MMKCDGCGDFVKRSKAKSNTVNNKERFFCCKGYERLFWQGQELSDNKVHINTIAH